jgi:hypothetical protein
MIEEPGLPDLTWVNRLPALTGPEIRTRLSALPVERQAELVLGLKWKDRLRIILNSDVAGDLVRSLPEEEVLLTIKGAGEEDALPLVALATGEQLRFILDVELWSRETLDDGKVRTWLSYLLGCGEAKIIDLVETADRDLLVLILSKLITLVPNEEGVRVPEGLPSIMPDEYFTILANAPGEIENVRLLLRILRQWNRDEFYKLLFEVHGCTGAETEEQALRWRNARLEEKGVLEFDEAVEVYGYIGEDEAREMVSRARSPRERSQAPGSVPPLYPILLAGGKTFFYEVVTGLQGTAILSDLLSQIAFTANRLLVADAHRIGEIDSIRSAVTRLFSLVNVGLLFLTGGDRDRAGEVLASVPVKEVFQIGLSRALDLRTRARSIASRWWPGWREDGFGFLDYPDDRLMEGLMLRVPQYLVRPGGGDTEFRDFETMREIHETGGILDRIEVVSETCFDKFGIPGPHRAGQVPVDILAGGIEGICFRNLLLTIFVNFVLRGSPDISPLAREDVGGLLEKVLEKSGTGEKLVRPRHSESFLSRLSGLTGYTGKRWDVLKTYFRASLKTLEDDVGKIASAEDLDPRYVGSLIFRGRSGRDGR